MKNQKNKIEIFKLKLLLIFSFFFVFLFTNTTYAICPDPMPEGMIFCEDNEATNFTNDYVACNSYLPADPWFLERSMGSSDCSYWSELTNEITRSVDSHTGLYSMTYDPWVNSNPHSNIGYRTDYGNTREFYLDEFNSTIWYFKWYHKWETGVDYTGSAANKNIYIGYGEWGGDFVLNMEKVGDNDWHLVIFKNPGYTITLNTYISTVSSTDDNQWHKMEVYINLGTTGSTGIITVTVDDDIIYNNTSVYYRDLIAINGNILNKMSWPANTSGDTTGTNQQWLDDMEIWTQIPSSDTTPPSHPTGLSVE